MGSILRVAREALENAGLLRPAEAATQAAPVDPRAAARAPDDLGFRSTLFTALADEPMNQGAVTLMSLTPEARETVKQRGFPMFGLMAAGGAGTLAALGGTGGSDEAKADDDKPLTPDEAEESAMVQRAMALGFPTPAVAAETVMPQSAMPTASAEGPGGSHPATPSQPAQPKEGGATAMDMAEAGVMGTPTQAAALALKHGPAILNDLRVFAWEHTLDPTDNQTVGIFYGASKEILEFADDVAGWMNDAIYGGPGGGDLLDPGLFIGDGDQFLAEEVGGHRWGPVGVTFTHADREAVLAMIRAQPGREQAGTLAEGAAEMPAGKSVIGAFVDPIAEFMMIFAATRKTIPGLGGSLAGIGGAGKAAVTGMITDQVIAYEDGVANLIQELSSGELADTPIASDMAEAITGSQLGQQIIDFMAYDAETPEAERRLKIAFEGMGFGLLADMIPAALRATARARSARLRLAEVAPVAGGAQGRGGKDGAPGGSSGQGEAIQSPTAKPAAPEPTPEADLRRLLGDPEDPAVFQLRQATARAVQSAEGATGSTGQIEADAIAGANAQTVDIGGLMMDLPNGTQMRVNQMATQSPEDVRAVLRTMAEAYAPHIEAARGGVYSDEALLHDAGNVDAWRAMMTRRQGSAMTPAETAASIRLWEDSGEQLLNLARRASETGSDIDIYAARRAQIFHAAVQAEVFAVQADTARAFRALGVAKTRGSEMARQLRDIIAVEGDGPGNLRAMFDAIATMTNRTQLEAAARLSTSDLIKGLISSWIANVHLWSPTTHARNLISNASVLALTVFERTAAERAAKALGREALVEIGEAAAMVHGMRTSFREAFGYFAHAIKTGDRMAGMQARMGKAEEGRVASLAQLLERTSNAVGLGGEFSAKMAGFLGAIAEAPGRFLGAADDLFSTLNYRASLNAQAFHRARGEFRAGKLASEDLVAQRMQAIVNEAIEGDPKWSGMRIEARETSMRNTFTRPTREGDHLTQAAMKLRRGFDNLSMGVLGRLFLPYINTPANILRFGFQRTPLAPLVGEFREAFRAGGRERFIALTNMAVGTALFAEFLALAHDGWITGGGPADPQLKDAWERSGWKPYTLKLPGMTTEFQYKGFDPVAMSMQLAADMFEIVGNTDYADRGYDDVEEMLAAGALSIASMLNSKSYFAGVSNLFGDLQDPTRGAQSSLERQTAAIAVPSFIRGLRRTGVGVPGTDIAAEGDPYLRYTASWLDEVKNLTPGLSASLPMRRDLWGRPIDPASTPGTWYDYFVPVHISDRSNAEAIDLEIIDQGFTGLAERSPSITLAGEGSTINLRAAERMDVFDRIQERAGTLRLIKGKTLLELMNSIVTPPEEGGDASLWRAYNRQNATDGPDGSKERFLAGFVSVYYTAARDQIARELRESNDPLVAEAERRQVHARGLRTPPGGASATVPTSAAQPSFARP